MTAEEILQDKFGLTGFRPGQREVITALDEHRAALAVFPTGGGKSLCYQLPGLMYSGVTVVISPLIALMKDQIDFLRSRGIAAARLDSSLTLEETREVNRGLRDASLKILYVAPERFNNERFLDQLGRADISLFAVDEAHCISEWGHNFRPDYLKLAETARQLKVKRVLALTATATPAVVADICRSFGIPPQGTVITGFHRPNLFLSTTPLLARDRDRALAERLRTRPPGSSIVYVTLQATAERVAGMLAESGVPARAYHAGMQDVDRVAVQEWWRDSDRNVVVATIAFGMGIDKADVRYVYHYNLPKGLESYGQEIGRAGRDGLPSRVEILGAQDDVGTLENFACGDTPTRQSLRGVLRSLLGGKPEFDVSLYSLGAQHDIRPLVLRTALTYLELMGVIRQGTPFYAGYKVKPLRALPDLIGRFSGERGDFIQAIFEAAKKGREWYSFDPSEVGRATGQDRERVIAAVDYLGEQGLAEVQVADARQRFTRLVEDPDVEGLVRELSERFERREVQEIRRIAQVVDLITHDGCQTALMLRYFGEELAGPCGHCTHCETGAPTTLPGVREEPPVDEVVNRQAVLELAASHPRALGEPRQMARFLCGLSSPAIAREKLGKHPLAGVLTGRRFGEVLEWCER